jgi:hypothetical protein
MTQKNEQVRFLISGDRNSQLKPYSIVLQGHCHLHVEDHSFTLAKAYNIFPLVHGAKATILDRMAGMSHC